jgi:DNA invertase Pin-like site-specific DNA recombinase
MSKITALYSRLSVGDEDRDGGESNSIQNQRLFLEQHAKQQKLINIKHYVDDDESGRWFDRPAYSAMIEDVRNGKIGTIIIKDMTRWGRDYLEVGNAMELMRIQNVRFIAINSGIDSAEPSTLEFAPFINIMSEWYAKDISKKVKTGIRTKGMSGKPVVTEAPYGYIKDPNKKDYWIIDEPAAEIVRLIFNLFMSGNNRNQIENYLREKQIPTPTFYMKEQDRGTKRNHTLDESKRFKWNKCTLTRILTRQEYCGDVVNFKTSKHFKDKRPHYVDKSEWHITENVHEPIIDRDTFENAQRILENTPKKRPNGNGYIHPLSGLLFCKDCGSKLHIRTAHRVHGRIIYVGRCAEYAKGKAKNAQCLTQHYIDTDILLENIAKLLRRIAEYSLENKEKFQALVLENLSAKQTDKLKKQKKRIPQITSRIEQIDRVLNKLYEDYALEVIDHDRYQQLSQKYTGEYTVLKKELAEIQKHLSEHENANGRAKKFIKLVENYVTFDEITPAVINQFIEKIVVHERHRKGVRQAIQHVEIHFNYIGTFENKLTNLTEPTEEDIQRMTAEIAEEQAEKRRAYNRVYQKQHREKNLEKYRAYEREKAREYREKKKQQVS